MQLIKTNVLALAMILFLIFSMSACGKSVLPETEEPVASAMEPRASAESTTIPPTNSPIPASASTAPEDEVEENVQSPNIMPYPDYIMQAVKPNGNDPFRADEMLGVEVLPGITLGMSPRGVKAVMGEPTDTYEHPYYCEYTYENARFFFLKDYAEKFYLCEIEITGGQFSGPRGIGSGDALGDIIEVFAVKAAAASLEFSETGNLILYHLPVENGSIPQEFASSDYVQRGYYAEKDTWEDEKLKYSVYFQSKDVLINKGLQLPDVMLCEIQLYAVDGYLIALTCSLVDKNPYKEIEYSKSDTSERVLSIFTEDIPAMAVPNGKKAFEKSDMIAGALKYGDTVERVRWKLGEPIDISSASDDLRSLDYIIYKYANGDEYVFMQNRPSGRYLLESVTLSDPETPGPRGIHVGDSMQRAMDAFRIEISELSLPEDERAFFDNIYSDGKHWHLLYARIYPYQEDDNGRLYLEPYGIFSMDSIDKDNLHTVYLPIQPYGMIKAMDTTADKPDVYELEYSFPLHPFDEEDIKSYYEMWYYTQGYLSIVCESGVVTSIAWYTHAAE